MGMAAFHLVKKKRWEMLTQKGARRIRSARAQVSAEFESVVGEVAGLEDRGDEEERQDQDCRAEKDQVRLQFESRGRMRRPRKRDVTDESFGALADDVRLEAGQAEAVPDGPEAVDVGLRAAPLLGHPRVLDPGRVFIRDQTARHRHLAT